MFPGSFLKNNFGLVAKMPFSLPVMPLKGRVPSSLPALMLFAIAISGTWTMLGLLLAVFANSIKMFWREWIQIQAIFTVAATALLSLLAFSPGLTDSLRQVTPNFGKLEQWNRRSKITFLRRLVISFVAITGAGTTASLGFASPPPMRYFMWLTCALVCTLAGIATWHGTEVLYAAYIATRIDDLKIKFFVYAPGETRSLKKLSSYFFTYGLAISISYVFVFLATMSQLWTGNPVWIKAVRAFWPIVYVPLCLIILTYPQLAFQRLIRQEKDRLIVSYQEHINCLIGDGQSLSHQDIERVNALADLIKRIESSPRFAVNFPIAAGTILTCMVNIASILIPKETVAKVINAVLSAP